MPSTAAALSLALLAALASAQQPDEAADNGPVPAGLNADQTSTLIQHIENVFREQSLDPCNADNPHLSLHVDQIVSVSRHIEHDEIDAYTVTAQIGCDGCDPTTVTMDVEGARDGTGRETDVDSVAFARISGLSNLDIFPACVAARMRAEVARRAADRTPSTQEERDEVARELRTPGIATIGHAATAANLRGTTQATAAKVHQEWHETTHELQTHEGYSLGALDEPAEVKAAHTVTLQTSSSVTSRREWSPFTGRFAACLANFPARNQGSCGSCYSFAATTAFSLAYCLEVYRRGYNHNNTAIPVLTVQNMGKAAAAANQATRLSPPPFSHTFPPLPSPLLL